VPQDVEFFMPYPRKTAAGLSAGMERHLRWARDMGFLPSEAAANRYRFCQHAEVGAWFCPEPGQDRDLDLQLDVNGWFFMLDDAFDVPAGQMADGAVAVCQRLMELLYGPPADAERATSPLVTAFADIWQREREGMSAFWQQRASCTWIGYLAGNLVEEANRRVATVLTPAEYMLVRRQSVGVLPAYDMGECVGSSEVPPLAWYSTHVAAMRRLSVEHVIMVNDVCSLEKDEARNETNLVSLLASQRGLSRGAAISHVVSMADDHMRQFQELEAGISHVCDRLALTDAGRTALHRHVVGMHDMVSGNYHWSRSCGRYSREAAALLSPERPSLLGLHDLTYPADVTPPSPSGVPGIHWPALRLPARQRG
jgi:pentalenene synthase